VIEDKKDSQTIFSFIIGGIFTLTIFSYTMVMNVLNRNINNYSPRLIPLILAERHHQLILGFTSGTIIYAMGMSLSLNNINDGNFPTIAAGLGIIFSGFCVLLFIYFIHSVSQSIHINYILHEVFKKAMDELDFEQDRKEFFSAVEIPKLPHKVLYKNRAGYLHRLDYSGLHKFCKEKNTDVHVVPLVGSFLLQEATLALTSRELNEEEQEDLLKLIQLDHTVCSDVFAASMKHLVEVAAKASSPAINDPGTSLGALDYITQLMIKRFKIPDHNCFSTANVKFKLYLNQLKSKDLFYYSYIEMYEYMGSDPLCRLALDKSIETYKELFPEQKFLETTFEG
jgi:uncharacterized membrane protein